jgi:hypothetical protein
MNDQELNQMRADVNHLLQSAKEQANTLILLLAVAKALKMPQQDIETAIDSLPLHPIVAAIPQGGGVLRRSRRVERQLEEIRVSDHILFACLEQPK